jgi:protein tyrosine/serine phosphatase
MTQPTTMDQALEHLMHHGPTRFAVVARGLFRGGHPDYDDLEALHVLGVRNLISLRRERRGLSREEQRHAHALGMHFHHFPFYGIFGAHPLFLEKILVEMRKGGVYIHCKNGRDRTSLLIALYRVRFEGWDPDVAWKSEVLGFGYRPTYFYRRLQHTFEAFVRRPSEAARP